MKRFIMLLALVAMVHVANVHAQSAACMGFKNPTNFSMYTNYSGQTGTKPSQTPNPLTGVTGMTFTGSVIPNTQLASQTSTQSCSSCSNALNGTNRFRIMTTTDGPGTGANQGKDPCVSYNLPYCPTDFTSSIRVGTCGTGAEAEALYYTMTVNANNALVFVNYAIVVEAPGHGVSGDPTFVVRVTKQNSSGQWQQISDTLCYMVSSTPTSSSGGTVVIGQNGWHSQGSGYSQVYYRDWNKVAINLYKYLYQQVRIEVMIGDCSAHGHYGYCYMTGDCKPMRLTANGCAAGESAAVATIAAPSGLSAYKWYRSRTGQTTSQNVNDYQMINGATDSVLEVSINDFILTNGDTVPQQSFMCEMTSYMDPQKPITSRLYTDVGNKKPTINVDSVLFCDGSITLRDLGFTRFVENDNTDRVDTSLTRWTFYMGPQPTGTPVAVLTGGEVTQNYGTAAGVHCVKVRTSARDTSCWNEKRIAIRTLTTPNPVIALSDNDLCPGDTIILQDVTPGSIYHKWIFYSDEGDEFNDTVVHPTSGLQRVFDKTTRVRLYMHTNQNYRRDTNADGVIEDVRCLGYVDTVVRVGQFPVLTVHGDTIVCNGDQSDVYVESDIANCTFDWYEVLNGSTPVQANSSHLITSINQDRRYYVKVTSPNGCVSWDSVNLYLVKPELKFSTDKICTGDTVKMWAGKAATYEWSANPDDDATFWGQEGNDTIWVSPEHTTTYQVIGRGTNGCGATPLTQKVTVYPYPIEAIELTPDYIDSENPSVQFSDVSEYGTSSLWNFGNGNTSTTRSVVWTFTDLSQDSILISLVTGNPLGCTSDTTFWVPIGIFSVWFPNAFTPKLETNNVFKVYTANDLIDYELYIYDRRGDLVFSTTDVNEAWDGTANGRDCAMGAYVYIAKYRRPGVERLMSQKGTVTLLR